MRVPIIFCALMVSLSPCGQMPAARDPEVIDNKLASGHAWFARSPNIDKMFLLSDGQFRPLFFIYYLFFFFCFFFFCFFVFFFFLPRDCTAGKQPMAIVCKHASVLPCTGEVRRGSRSYARSSANCCTLKISRFCTVVQDVPDIITTCLQSWTSAWSWCNKSTECFIVHTVA